MNLHFGRDSYVVAANEFRPFHIRKKRNFVIIFASCEKSFKNGRNWRSPKIEKKGVIWNIYVTSA